MKKVFPGDADSFVNLASRGLRGQRMAQTRLGKPASLALTTAMRGNHGHKTDRGKSGLHAHEFAGPFHLVGLHELQHKLVTQ